MIIHHEIVLLSLKSIWRNKTRSALTMLGIIIGVSAVILLVSIGQGLQTYITAQFENLGTNLVVVVPGQIAVGDSGGASFAQGPPNFAGSKLTLKQTEGLDRLGPPIEAAGAAIEIPASVHYLGKSKFTTVAGVTANYSQIRNLTISRGRVISKSDVDIGRNVAVLGKGITETFFGSSDPLGKEISISNQRFQVIGILNDLGTASFGVDINNFVALPITSAQKVFGNKSVQAMVIKATSKEDIPLVIRKAKTYLSTQLKDDEFTVIDQSSLLSTINQILGVLTIALGGIAAISLVVGGVGIMNIMLVSVSERTREIGLRKAVGAKQNDILFQFLVESIVLSGTGGFFGILLGSLGALGINKVIATTVTPWSVILAFGVSAAVGIIFGVMPAYRASRLDPIEALRYE